MSEPTDYVPMPERQHMLIEERVRRYRSVPVRDKESLLHAAYDVRLTLVGHLRAYHGWHSLAAFKTLDDLLSIHADQGEHRG